MLLQNMLFVLFFVGHMVRALPTNADDKNTTSIDANFYRVLICEDVYFQGRCDYIVRQFDFCQPFGADWSNKISSIQPAKDAICGIYVSNDCTGLVDQMLWPGSSDLVGTKFNDLTSSLKCWKSA